MIASDIAGAGINWGTPDQHILGKVSLEQMEQYVEQGQFPAGSMGPKVEAAMQFVGTGGTRAVIASIEAIEAAVEGKTGTEIYKG